MGFYSVYIDIDCVADDGTPLKFREQVMDAFIGYMGKGERPPHDISIKKDRLARDSYGAIFDPAAMGYDYNEECIQAPDGEIWRIVIDQGAVTTLERVPA